MFKSLAVSELSLAVRTPSSRQRLISVEAEIGGAGGSKASSSVRGLTSTESSSTSGTRSGFARQVIRVVFGVLRHVFERSAGTPPINRSENHKHVFSSIDRDVDELEVGINEA